MDGVVAIVNYNGKILLGKKRSDSPKFFAGKWHVPGGTIEEGESDEIALIREIKEEANLNITVGKYLGENSSPTHRNLRWYECSAETDKAIAGSDLEDVKWVGKNEVLSSVDSRLVSLLSEDIINYFLS